MTTKARDFNVQRKGIIDILRESLAEVERHHTTLERKLQYNMAFISSLAALEIVVHLPLLEHDTVPPPMESALTLFAFTFFGVALIFVFAIWPQSRGSLPFEPTWANVKEWWKFDIIEFRDRILSGYVKIWTQNQELLIRKVMWTRLSYVLVALALFVVGIQASLYWHHLVFLPSIN